MKLTRKFFLYFFLLSFGCHAQIDFPFLLSADTTVIKGISYTLSYTSRLSIIAGDVIPIRGVHGGVKFGKNRHRLSLAYFWSNLDPNVSLLNFRNNAMSFLDLSSFTKKDLHYYNLMYYPYWYNSPRWKFSTPLELGVGTLTSPKVSVFKELAPYQNGQYFVPLQLGVYLEFKALRHFGVNAELGYRLILAESQIPFELNGIYFGLGANIYTGVLWRDYQRLLKR